MVKKDYLFIMISLGISVLFLVSEHAHHKKTYTWDYNQEINVGNGKMITVSTFNMQYGKGTDNRVNLNRTIETLRELDADIISLQEVERNSVRSNFKDQVTVIAESLGMNAVFSPSLSYPGLYYGNAILSRYPIQDTMTLPFSNRVENRSAILAKLELTEGQSIYVLNTHLGLNQEERLQAIDEIHQKLSTLNHPIILTADLNSLPVHNEYVAWSDLLAKANEGTPIQTYRHKDWQIDYIFHSRDFIVRQTTVVESEASDHFPVTAMLLLKREQ
ncbi:endonuclease/exonuclease/phosphatase family protein [Halalkalibacter alkalisediminis]|uniref:Endonuclease/exonuclease/phosphatase family protein n=1 Tax=Halalkalibacter alkalisediminis TaxID=935616 RepID=A0ABV6NH20_9BACI|nr:endonuclease/exonuclease/phosphatase family protein [Halalkalibacter alkalisediminis]